MVYSKISSFKYSNVDNPRIVFQRQDHTLTKGLVPACPGCEVNVFNIVAVDKGVSGIIIEAFIVHAFALIFIATFSSLAQSL